MSGGRKDLSKGKKDMVTVIEMRLNSRGVDLRGEVRFGAGVQTVALNSGRREYGKKVTEKRSWSRRANCQDNYEEEGKHFPLCI